MAVHFSPDWRRCERSVASASGRGKIRASQSPTLTVQTKKPAALSGELLPALAPEVGAPLLHVLPSYSDDMLRELSAPELIRLMIKDEDRVPLNVIEEGARRGPEMEALLEPLFSGAADESESDGQRWLRLHALNILGLMSSASAGAALLRSTHWMAENEQDILDVYSMGNWRAWLQNKPYEVLVGMQQVLEDRNLDAALRLHLLGCALSLTADRWPELLEIYLDMAAARIADDSEHPGIRPFACLDLLAFPRSRHRALLERQIETLTGGDFTVADVRVRFTEMTDDPASRHIVEEHSDPLAFYSPEAMEARQREGWERGMDFLDDDDLGEGAPLFQSPAGFHPGPYTREAPKVGRNEPCPCGSGKKYKKCCLAAAL
ncbi:MAG: SEC-C metal-binding domain-containing protein [Luteibacter sp.]